MKKIGKVLVISLGILVLALIAIAIALPFLIDPNNYKNQIIQAVKQQTGRDLKIGGKIGWSVFPWLGVEMHRLELSNAPGFGNQPFARVETAGVKVKLLPLLKKDVVVDKVLLTGLNLNLAKDQTGKTNWDDLMAKSPAATPAPREGAGAPAINAVSVGGVDLRAGEISWKDQTSGATYILHNVELKSGELVLAKPMDIKLALDLESTAPAFRTHVDLKTRVAVDVDKQTLDVSGLELAAAGLKLKADAKGSRISSAPAFSGDLELAPFSPRAFLEKLGLKLDTADKTALGQATLATKFDASAKHLQLKNFNASLDDSKLNGSLEIANFAPPSYRFDLMLDNFDLDRYLPPAAPAKTPPGQGAGKPQPATAPIPLDAIRKLNAEGSFRIGKFKAFGVRSSDVLISLAAKDGAIKLNPTQAKLYGGAYKGAIGYDARTPNPALTIEQQLTGVQLGSLLKDAGVFDKFSGVANVVANLSARGLDIENMKQTLNGEASFSVRDGKIQGVNLRKMVNDTRAAVDKFRGKPVPAATSAGDQTEFSQLTGTVKVRNGLANNEDLNMQAPFLRVGGKGTANLPKSALDYQLKVNIADDPARQGTTVPVNITGSFSDPKFSVDWNAILKAEAGERLEKEKEKAKEELKQQLDKRLKDLFKK